MTDVNHHSVTMLDYHRGSSTRPGKQCVRVSVNLVNSDSADWLTPLNGVQLSDARGFLYYRSDDCGTTTTLQTLAPGQSASAILYFEILANATVDFNWHRRLAIRATRLPCRRPYATPVGRLSSSLTCAIA